MKRHIILGIMALACPALVISAGAQAKNSPAPPAQQPAAIADNADKNMQAYAELLRSNVRQRKAEVMAEMMQLSAADAAKFWPVYDDYDRELAKLTDLRVETIQEYARTYTQMTDGKADELIRKALTFRRQRSELIEKYYGRMKAELGAITAARFVQVEDQLLMIIDLQIDSALPIVGASEATVPAGAVAEGVVQ